MEFLKNKYVLGRIEKYLEKRAGEGGSGGSRETKLVSPAPRVATARQTQARQMLETETRIRQLKNETRGMQRGDDEASKKRLEAARQERDDAMRHLAQLKRVW